MKRMHALSPTRPNYHSLECAVEIVGRRHNTCWPCWTSSARLDDQIVNGRALVASGTCTVSRPCGGSDERRRSEHAPRICWQGVCRIATSGRA